jgi:osmotically inducible protein OsmC
MRLGGGAFEGPYSFSSRFEEGEGTNPEELLAAAHAGCFSMALSATLERAGYSPSSVETEARVHLVKGDSGFSITQIELDCKASVPGIDAAKFAELAESAKQNCPVSRLFQGAEIHLNAQLS